MIALYPRFSRLGLSHKEEIQTITSKFEPYSDFNFTSLFCWNTDESTEVSILNENLVIKLPDYVTRKPVYSILGDHKIDDSLEQLLSLTNELKMVPEVVVNNIAAAHTYSIEPDRDHFDYVYPLDKQADLPGGHYKVKRNKISKFMRHYGSDLTLKKVSLSDNNKKHEIVATFDHWTKERQRNDDEAKHEREALERLLENAGRLDLICLQVFIDGTSVGFSINEVVQQDYAICHFQKSNLAFEHTDVFLSNIIAKELKHFGCRYVNWEQDLGIEGLRELKMSYSPEFFLKKYTVSLNKNS